jgi:hypothetical protein
MLHYSLVGQYRTLLAIVLKRATKKMRLVGFGVLTPMNGISAFRRFYSCQKKQE